MRSVDDTSSVWLPGRTSTICHLRSPPYQLVMLWGSDLLQGQGAIRSHQQSWPEAPQWKFMAESRTPTKVNGGSILIDLCLCESYILFMLVYLSSLYELGLICKMWRFGKDEHYIFSTCRLESSLPLLIKQHFATPLASWLERRKLIQGSLWHPALPRWLVLSAMTTSQLSKVWAKNSEWLRNQLASWLQLLQLDSWLGQTTNICQTPHLLEEFALWSLRLRIWSALNELEPPWVCQPSQWNWPQAQLA